MLLYKPFMTISILFILLGLTPMTLRGAETAGNVQEDATALAYISTQRGLDVIIIRSGLSETMVYQCSDANEMILTPQVSYDRRTIGFAIENGTGLRTIHVLILKQEDATIWSARDSILVAVNGGAWPQYTPEDDLYLSMKNPERMDFTTATDIYRVNGLDYVRISENNGADRHLWPLLSPRGDQLHFRKIVKSIELDQTISKQSIIYDLKSKTQEIHLADENLYVEQWTATGQLLYSRLHAGEKRSRSYYLYNIGSHQSTEIHQCNSWQAQLSVNEVQLATLQQYPEGNPQFDIFITDLSSGEEVNLTNSPYISESLIGWIK